MKLSLGGAFIGLVLGTLAGAGVFARSGNLDLLLGFISMIVFAVLGAAFGSLLAPLLTTWNEQRRERHPINRPLMATSQRVLLRDNQAPARFVSTEVFSVDKARLLTLFAASALRGLVILYFVFDLGYGLLPFALGSFVFAFYQLAKLLRNADLQVRINQDGFHYTSRGRQTFVGWQQIDKVWEKKQKVTWNGIPFTNVHTLRISTLDGKIITLSRILRRFQHLADTVQEVVTSHLLPAAIVTLHRGGVLDFNAFSLTDQEIRHKQRLLPWGQVKRIIIWQARIQVRSTERNWINWAEARAWDVANFPLFVIIISRYVEVD